MDTKGGTLPSSPQPGQRPGVLPIPSGTQIGAVTPGLAAGGGPPLG